MTPDSLTAILAAHRAWLYSESGGQRAVLTGCDLTGANLTGANLTDAVLTRAVLTDAVLTRAVLTRAVLTDAVLTRAVLTGAVLTDAVLTGCVLTGCDLTGADLGNIRADLFLILKQSRHEVPSLLAALRDGRIDGSTYTGECACLCGTIANARRVDVKTLPFVDANRPAERWFLAIRRGDTPAISQVAKITEGWIEEFLSTSTTEVVFE